MLKFILSRLKGVRDESSKTTVRRWTEIEPERVRTFEESTQSSSGGGFSVAISTTTELATSRQKDFLEKLGFSGEGLTKGEATYLLDRILRPVNYALSKTFKDTQLLPKEYLRALQIEIVHWDYYTRLPRYGPHATWKDLEASGNDPHRPLTKWERIAITDIAFRALPAGVFLSLKSNGVKQYKAQLDAAVTPHT